MDAVSCYFHKHELEDVDAAFYGCDYFEDLPEDPDIDYTFIKNGKTIPIFKINRIMGTVLDRDKLKKTVTLLTTDGVVTVKIYGQIFSNYDKQIYEKGADGKKHIVEKSWFTRGNKIIVTGMRRGTNEFVAKKYKKTPYSLVELITSVDGSYLETRGEREDVE
jgi:DNA polymerase-3 subunit alpha